MNLGTLASKTIVDQQKVAAVEVFLFTLSY